jgi:hypothetical protein
MIISVLINIYTIETKNIDYYMLPNEPGWEFGNPFTSIYFKTSGLNFLITSESRGDLIDPEVSLAKQESVCSRRFEVISYGMYISKENFQHSQSVSFEFLKTQFNPCESYFLIYEHFGCINNYTSESFYYDPEEDKLVITRSILFITFKFISVLLFVIWVFVVSCRKFFF